MTKRLSLLFALVFGFFFLNASVAYADDSTLAADAAAALATGNHAYGEVASSINSELTGTDIGIVVFSHDELSGTLNATQLAAKISENSPYSITIVAIDSDGKDAYGVVGPKNGEITSILYSSESENVNTTLKQSLNEIISLTKTTSTTSSSPGGSNSIGETLMTGGLSLVGILVLGAVGAVIFKKLRARGVNKKADITYKKLPPTIEKKLETFKHIIAKHRQAKNTALVGKLEDILLHSQELFKRLDRKGAEQNKRMAEVSYGDTLEKLNQALGEDYYLDIMSHPQLWDNASHRMSEVRDAVIATDNQIVQNIREVNAARDLTMKVALESLTRSMDRTDVNDMFNRTQESS